MNQSSRSLIELPYKKINHKNLVWDYLIVGEAKNNLIMFPGGLRRPVYWIYFLEKLSKEFKILIPVYPRISDMSLLAEGVNQIMEEESIDKAHIYGSSFGGLMCQAFVLKYPNKVNKIIIANSGTIKEDIKSLRKMKIFLILIRILPSFIVRRFMIKIFSDMVPSDALNRENIVSLIKNVIKSKELDKKDIICHFKSLLYFQKELGITDEFTFSIQEKILIITSENDKGVSSDANKYLEKMYPKATFYNFKEGSHMPLLVNPQKYLNLIVNFLKS